MNRPEALLLDLDGTLVDSVHLHTIAWTEALHRAGHDIPASAVQPLIGMGGPQLLDALLGRHDADLDDEHGRRFEKLRPQVRPLPGARHLLERAREEGVRAYVVTSSKPADVEFLLAMFSDDTIEGYVHGEDVSRTKPHPDLFETAMARWGIRAERALAVGDSEWDIRSAQEAGLRGVGLLTGGTSSDRLFNAGAIAVFRSCEDLAALALPVHRSGQ